MSGITEPEERNGHVGKREAGAGAALKHWKSPRYLKTAKLTNSCAEQKFLTFKGFLMVGLNVSA
jgi:hypothetical protein